MTKTITFVILILALAVLLMGAALLGVLITPRVGPALPTPMVQPTDTLLPNQLLPGVFTAPTQTASAIEATAIMVTLQAQYAPTASEEARRANLVAASDKALADGNATAMADLHSLNP